MFHANSFLLAYLSIGALSFATRFILSASTRQSVIEFVTENAATGDALGIGLDVIFHILLLLFFVAGGIIVWPLVWAALGIGTWRLKKERKA